MEQGFLPWLVDCVEEELNKRLLGRVMLDDIIRVVAEYRESLHGKRADTDKVSDDGMGGVDLEIPEPPVSWMMEWFGSDDAEYFQD